MKKTEVKKLLKRREELLLMHHQLNDAYNPEESDKINSIYINGRNNIDCIIYDIDLKLLEYARESAIGKWLLNIKGITPDLACSLLAYFSVKDKNCAAQFISFAGIDNRKHPHNEIAHTTIKNIIKSFKSYQDSYYNKLRNDKFNQLLSEDIDEITASIRSDRYISKIFISHLFEEMYREENNGSLPKRYQDDDNLIIEPEVYYTK